MRLRREESDVMQPRARAARRGDIVTLGLRCIQAAYRRCSSSMVSEHRNPTTRSTRVRGDVVDGDVEVIDLAIARRGAVRTAGGSLGAIDCLKELECESQWILDPRQIHRLPLRRRRRSASNLVRRTTARASRSDSPHPKRKAHRSRLRAFAQRKTVSGSSLHNRAGTAPGRPRSSTGSRACRPRTNEQRRGR
jgi:hypothetical protein